MRAARRVVAAIPLPAATDGVQQPSRKGQRASLSTFVPAARTSRAKASEPKTLRSPDAAVSFVERFNDALGLSGKALSGKNDKLTQDAFGFFRGMPALFMADVKGPYAAASALFDRPSPVGLIDGDPHLGNFGTLKGPDGSAVWGLDDFDQAGQGKVEWDLERLATSAVLAARQSKLSPQAETQLVRDVASHYFAALADYAKSGVRPAPTLGGAEATGEVADAIQSADARSQKKDVLAPLTHKNKDGELRFHGSGLGKVKKKDEKALTAALKGYAASLPASAPVARPLEILDLATESGKGGSSYGLSRYLALVADADPSKPPHVLELKQEMPSAVSDGTGDLSRADAAADVANQKTLSGFLDPLMGAVTLGDGSYLIRELQPQGAKALKSGLGFGALDSLATQAGEALARSHAQSLSADAVGEWIGSAADQRAATDNLVAFAEAYANQTEADRHALKKAL